MSILKTTDFSSGLTKISQDQYVESELLTFLSDVKLHGKIRNILGVTLGQELIDDLTGNPAVPSSAKFTAIWTEFNFSYSDLQVYSMGLKDILVHLVYCDFVSQQSEINQQGGNRVVQQEASTPGGFSVKFARVYNEAVRSIEALQLYVNDNDDTYEDFEGINYYYTDLL